MTLTSFDLVSDFDGSIKKTFNDTDYDSAVLNTIHELGYVLLYDQNESGLYDCRLIQTELGDIEHEFVSHSADVAPIEALTLLGHSIFESLTEAELNANTNRYEDEDEEFDEYIENMEDIEYGKIVAFEL
jgi:hypothetical protein